MKAVLINVKDRTVTDVEIKGKVLNQWYKLLNCHLVTIGTYLDDHDSIMVDDEGLFGLDSESMFFTFKGAHQPFAGNGLIVGVDDEGNSVSPNVTANDVRSKIKFHTLSEVSDLVEF